MEVSDLIGALVIGLAAGILSGLVGVGGGILFVPGLVLFLDEPILRAESTSLVAIVAVASVGAWRQRGYGNVRLRDAVLIGGLAPLGVLLGGVASNSVPERALELGFAAVQVFFAIGLLRRAFRAEDDEIAPAGDRHSP